MKIILLPCRFTYIKRVNKRNKILFSRLHAPDVYFRRGLMDPAFIYLAPAFFPSLVLIRQVDFFISLVNN